MEMNDLLTPITDRVASHDGSWDTKALRMGACSRDLERLLTACRSALESITHDMGASPQIHQLCVETLELTAPKS